MTAADVPAHISSSTDVGGLQIDYPSLLEQARDACTNQTSQSFSSKKEDAVSRCLTAMGVAHECSFWCKKSQHSIDIVISGTRIALEVGGARTALAFVLRSRLPRTGRLTFCSSPSN
jgi:hypothetical protein